MTKETTAQSVDFLLVQVCKLHYARAHVLLEALGLYRGQPPLLELLWEQEGRSHSELAARLQVQPATITRMIQRMERAGFVVRRSDPTDERVSRVFLTAEGAAIRQDAHRVRSRMAAEALAGFSQEEQERLGQLLERIRANLLAVNADEPPQ